MCTDKKVKENFPRTYKETQKGPAAKWPFYAENFLFFLSVTEAEAKTTASHSRNLSEVCTDCTVYSMHYMPHVFYMCVWSAVGNKPLQYYTCSLTVRRSIHASSKQPFFFTLKLQSEFLCWGLVPYIHVQTHIGSRHFSHTRAPVSRAQNSKAALWIRSDRYNFARFYITRVQIFLVVQFVVKYIHISLE